MATRRKVANSTASILRNAREQTMLASLAPEFHDMLAECAAGKRPKDIKYETRRMATSRRHQFYRLRPLLMLQKLPGILESTAFVLSVEEDENGHGWIRFAGVPNPTLGKIAQIEQEAARDMERASSTSEDILKEYVETDLDKIREKMRNQPPMSPEEAERIARNAQEAALRQQAFKDEVMREMKRKKAPAPDSSLDVFDALKFDEPKTEQQVDAGLREIMRQNSQTTVRCLDGKHEWDITETFCVKCTTAKPLDDGK